MPISGPEAVLSNILELQQRYWQDRVTAFQKYWDFYEGDKQRFYMQRFEGETPEKYRERVGDAVIENHCKPICNVSCGYLYGKEVKRIADDEDLQGFLLDRVWETNHLWSFMLEVALMASVTGFAVVALQLIDKETGESFDGNPRPAMVRDRGSILYKLLDSSSCLPLPRGDQASLGGILRIFSASNESGSSLLDKLLEKEYQENTVVEFITDEVWYRWINEKMQAVEGTLNGENPYGAVAVPFVLFKNYGDPMQLEGNPDHYDAIPLNTELNTRSNDDGNVISHHSFPVLKWLNCKAPIDWIRGPNSGLEFTGDGNAEYLVWDNVLGASQKRQEDIRKQMIRVVGYSDVSFGNTEELGEIRSGPALKTLFINDMVSIYERRAQFEKAEKWLIKSTARMWEHHAGVKFSTYKSKILFPDDFLGIDELLKTQMDEGEVRLGVKGIDEIIRRDHPELVSEEDIRERIQKNKEYKDLVEPEPPNVGRVKTMDQSELEQRGSVTA